VKTNPGQQAVLDRLENAYHSLWRERGLDLSGERDDELVALRSALVTLDLVTARAKAHGDLRSAVTEARRVLGSILFPERRSVEHPPKHQG
jgi:hypothetical protein